MNWLMEDFEDDRDGFGRLKEAAKQRAINVIDVTGFSGEQLQRAKMGASAFNGSIDTAKRLQLGSYPFRFHFDQYMYTSYFGVIHLLNSSIRVTTLEKFVKHPILEDYEQWRLFVRPNDALKTFPGQVIDEENFDEKVKLLQFYDPDPNTQVITADYHAIGGEWRCFMQGKKCITASKYMECGEPVLEEGCPEDVKVAAEAAVQRWEAPHSIYMLDMAESRNYKNPEFLPIEVNPFFTAAIYACDADKIVETVMRSM